MTATDNGGDRPQLTGRVVRGAPIPAELVNAIGIGNHIIWRKGDRRTMQEALDDLEPPLS